MSAPAAASEAPPSPPSASAPASTSKLGLSALAALAKKRDDRQSSSVDATTLDAERERWLDVTALLHEVTEPSLYALRL